MKVYTSTKEDPDLLLENANPLVVEGTLGTDAFTLENIELFDLSTNGSYLLPNKLVVFLPRSTTILNVLVATAYYDGNKPKFADLLYKEIIPANLVAAQHSGRQDGWHFDGFTWYKDSPLLEWLYVRAFQHNSNMAERLVGVTFGGTTSVTESCAKACALAVSLHNRGLLEKLTTPRSFLNYLLSQNYANLNANLGTDFSA
jgi:hypothetical protein